MPRAAAFFDLDRTLIRKSSTLALAPAFRRRGIITRRGLAKAGVLQILFMARGADDATVRRSIATGFAALRGFPVAEMQALLNESLERVLRPLVYAEAEAVADEHRARDERLYVVSAGLQEIAEALARALRFDGALGSVCESVEGVYTGRVARALHGHGKGEAVAELARERGYDLGACAAYSDSASDVPLLELVGRPVAVNPDRELRRVAQAREWEIIGFRRRARLAHVAGPT